MNTETRHEPPRQLTLADLIRERQDRTGDSYATIAKRAGLSKAKIGQLALVHQPHMPRVDTLEKLAAGLQLPLHVVQRAAMVTAGITPPDDDPSEQRLELLVAQLRDLAPGDLDTVALFVSALRQRRSRDG